MTFTYVAMASFYLVPTLCLLLWSYNEVLNNRIVVFRFSWENIFKINTHGAVLK